MIRALNATPDEVRLFLGNETGQLWRLGEDQSHCPVAEDERGWYWQTPIREEGFVFWDRVHIASPYQPGDVLWVREAWLVAADMDGYSTFYRADGEDIPGPWHYSITMPRKHSRVDIEITAVAAKQVDDVWQWVFDWRRIKP